MSDPMTPMEQAAMAVRQAVLMVGPLLAIWGVGHGVDWLTIATSAGVLVTLAWPHVKAWRERRSARDGQ